MVEVSVKVKAVVPLFVAFHFLIPCLWAQEPSSAGTIPPCAKVDIENPGHMLRPKYPKDALRTGVGGKVELRALIAPDGKTKELTVLEGNPEFARASLEAVRKWHFHAVLMQGHLAETTYKVHVRFDPLLQEAVSEVELDSPQPDLTSLSASAEITDETSGGPVYKSAEPGVVGPKALYQPIPEFTEQARQAKESGSVTLSLVVGVDGVPRDVSVLCSSVPHLNTQALETIKRWKFEPGTKGGKPVMIRVAVDFSFSLY